ncbi:hypothetical protein PSACC_00120, partial [Paramicrosporidium saccamoebae]
VEGEFDLGLAVSIGYFIPSRIINSFPLGMLNAHPSILPKYRGASPLQYTIMNCDTETGVSIIDLDTKEFDAGNIWHQRTLSIDPCRSFRDLEEQLAYVSAESLLEVIADFPRFKAQKQAQVGIASYAPKIQRSDAKISLDSMTRLDIFGRYQAISHQEKIYATLLDGKEVSFLNVLDPRETVVTGMSPTQFASLDGSCPPGSTFFERPTKIVWIKCLDGWLPVTSFRLPNKSAPFLAPAFHQAVRLVNFQPNFQDKQKITPRDRAILDLKVQRDRLKQYQKKVVVILGRETEIAKAHLAAGNKPLALLALKKKKYQEGLLESTSAQLLNLEQLVEQQVLHGLRQGNSVLTELQKEMSLDEVEKLMSDTAEAEISAMLSGKLTEEDEEDLEAELAQLQAELV